MQAFHLSVFQYNTLVNMYFRFGSQDTALNLFDRMPLRNESSWNTVISGCFRCRDLSAAMGLFSEMREEGFEANGFVLASLLTGCNLPDKENLLLGFQLHGLSLKAGIMDNVYVGTALLHLYGSFRFVTDAQRLFLEMPEKNVVSWTALMAGCSRNGDPVDVVCLYQQMRNEGLDCNEKTFATVISSCGLLLDCEKLIGLQVLSHAVVSGFGSDVSVANSAITLLDSLGRIGEAEYLFYHLKQRDTISWNSMMTLYSRSGMLRQSIDCFSEMRSSDIQPTATTISSLISASTCIDHRRWGRSVHALAVKYGLIAHISVSNTLISMYSSNPEEAEAMFGDMAERDIISWNSMISSYAQNCMCDRALELLSELLLTRMEVNYVTLASSLAACSSLESIRAGKMVHNLVIQLGLQENLILRNALITMYSKCNCMENAELLFRIMRDHDVITWNALIGGHVENEEKTKAVQLFRQMRLAGIAENYITMANVLGALSSPVDLLPYGKPIHARSMLTGCESNEFVKNSLLTMYSKCGDFKSSMSIFDSLANKTLVSWNAMISSKAHHGLGEDALKLFMKMRHAGVGLDQFSVSGALAACTSLASLEEGYQLHSLIIRLGFESDIHVNDVVMDMYGKSGSLDNMLKVIPKPMHRSRQSWNIMVSAFARHGYFVKAERTFEEMLQMGMMPDYVTFVSLLSACNHAGLVDRGLDYYSRMISDFGISSRIEHCVCIVDLLGRCGRLLEAERFIEEMPVPPNDFIWRSLLASSRTHKNMEIARKAAQRLFALNPSDDSAYVLLSNVCATNGVWDDVEKLRVHMESINLKKMPACSWIKVKNEVNLFGSGDRIHSKANEINAKLEEMLQMVRELGYVAVTSCTLHDVDEEQKEQNLWNHSEKLALAFGLISEPKWSSLRIFKNIRVCGDCHLVYKLVSKAFDREIMLRDPFRFHHFKDGECSCGDFW